VSVHAAMVVLFYISNEISLHGRYHPTPSMIDRIVVTARINCILDAINDTFFKLGAKYSGKPIQVDYFKDLDRKLFITPQHIVSAIGELDELLVSMTEAITRRVLRQMIDSQHGSKKRWKSYPNPEWSKIADDEQKASVQQYLPDPTWARIPWNKGLKQFARECCERVTTLDPLPNMNPSTGVFFDELNFLRNRSMESPRYEADPINDANDPIKIEGETEKGPILKVTKNEILVRWHYLANKAQNDEAPHKFLERIICDIFTKKHQFPEHFVWVVKESAPHVREVLSVPGEQPGSAEINIPSVVRMSTMDMEMLKGLGKYDDTLRTCHNAIIDCDLATWALKKRNEILFINEMKIDPSFLTSNPLKNILSSRRYSKKKQEEASKDDDSSSDDDSSEEDEDDSSSDDEPSKAEVPANLFDDSDSETGHSDKEGEKSGDEENYDDPYDESTYNDQVGYFLGERLDKLYMDDTKSLQNLDMDTIEKIYQELDYYNEKEIENDIDFDPNDAIIKTDEETGKITHHWDVLAQEELDAGTPPEECVFYGITDEDRENLTSEELEKKERDNLRKNIRKYKLICVHPRIVDHFENVKYYSHDMKFSYPEDMEITVYKTRQERYTKAKSLALTDANIKEILKDKSKIYSFLAYELDENGEVYRNPNNVYTFAEKSLGGALKKEYIEAQNKSKERIQKGEKRRDKQQRKEDKIENEGNKKKKKQKTQKFQLVEEEALEYAQEKESSSSSQSSSDDEKLVKKRKSEHNSKQKKKKKVSHDSGILDGIII
jgi:hypothetical protein